MHVAGKLGKLPKAKLFNASNRGYPDISVFGHNYLVIDEGHPISVDGTSASAPTRKLAAR